MTTVITQRAVTPADLAPLVTACSPATLGSRFFLPGRPDPLDILQRYRRFLLDGGSVAVAGDTGDTGDTVVGLLNVVPAHPRVAELGIMVADPWQRRGIATELARSMCDSGRWAGWTIRATTQSDNAAARALLRRRGFRPRGGAERGEVRWELTMPSPEETGWNTARASAWCAAPRSSSAPRA